MAVLLDVVRRGSGGIALTGSRRFHIRACVISNGEPQIIFGTRTATVSELRQRMPQGAFGDRSFFISGALKHLILREPIWPNIVQHPFRTPTRLALWSAPAFICLLLRLFADSVTRGCLILAAVIKGSGAVIDTDKPAELPCCFFKATSCACQIRPRVLQFALGLLNSNTEVHLMKLHRCVLTPI